MKEREKPLGHSWSRSDDGILREEAVLSSLDHTHLPLYPPQISPDHAVILNNGLGFFIIIIFIKGKGIAEMGEIPIERSYLATQKNIVGSAQHRLLGDLVPHSLQLGRWSGQSGC